MSNRSSKSSRKGENSSSTKWSDGLSIMFLRERFHKRRCLWTEPSQMTGTRINFPTKRICFYFSLSFSFYFYNSIKLRNILKFVAVISLYIKFVIMISLYIVINYTYNLLLKGKYEFKNTAIIFRILDAHCC